MDYTLDQLAKFLVKAKIQTYAGEGLEVLPQRPGFKELEFIEGDFSYRDSYVGFFFAPGHEVVRFKEEPIWSMIYGGGMLPTFQSDVEFAQKTYQFLKQALLRVEESEPFRGPKKFENGEFSYHNSTEGDIARFFGVEEIFFHEKKVFGQNYMGGLILPKGR